MPGKRLGWGEGKVQVLQHPKRRGSKAGALGAAATVVARAAAVAARPAAAVAVAVVAAAAAVGIAAQRAGGRRAGPVVGDRTLASAAGRQRKSVSTRWQRWDSQWILIRGFGFGTEGGHEPAGGQKVWPHVSDVKLD